MKTIVPIFLCLISGTVHAGGGCSTCAPVNAIVRQPYIAAAQPYVKQGYIQYYPVQYAVAPWLQAQAEDTYRFRGSTERLELERLRGYVARVQEEELNQVQEEPQQEVQPGFDEPPPTQQQQQAAPAPPPAIRPLTQFHCARCHNQEKQSGGMWIDANAPFDGPEYDAARGKIWRVLDKGRMPLGPDGDPHPLDRQTINDIMRELSGADPADEQVQPAAPAPLSVRTDVPQPRGTAWVSNNPTTAAR